MLAPEEDMEISALRKQGWSISAIARHLGRDRKTVRRYLNGEAEAGVRVRQTSDPFDRVEPYVRQRLGDDAHLWTTVLFAEVAALGYGQSYPTFVRKLRVRELRPHCEPCSGVKGRATVEIEHPPGEEIQWDWLELSDTPWGEKALVLVGALSHSSQFRAFITDSDDQAHLVEGIDQVLRRLGGTTRVWRVDRMATVINPQTGKIQASFVPVAKHYGVRVVPCPPRRGNRKGVVEKNIHYLTQRWWRTAAVSSLAEAQASLDRFCAETADLRFRDHLTVAEAGAGEPLLPLPPIPYPAEITVSRLVAANGLVSVWGNRYSVSPGLIGTEVTIRHRLGTATIEIVSAAGNPVASHRLAPRGANRTMRLPEHTQALENVILASFSTARPCKKKVNRPPSEAARRIAAEIGGIDNPDPVIDLGVYQRFIDRQGDER